MAASKRGFFRSLFGRRRRERFELSLGSVLAKALERNLAAVTGAETTVTSESVEVAAALAAVKALGPGTLIGELRDTETPALILVIPDSLLGTAGAGPAAAAAATAWRIADRVGDFLGLEPAAGESGLRTRPAHTYAKRYGDKDWDQLGWRLSGCSVTRLEVGVADGGDEQAEGPAVYACIDDATASRVERAFVEDEPYAEAVKAWALGAPAAVAGEPSRRLEIRGPRELALGSLFAPQRVVCGKYVLETRFEAIASGVANPKAYGPGTGAWVQTTCGLAGRKWSAWYFFPSGRDGKPGAGGAAKGIASCLFRDALRSLASTLRVAPEKPSIAVDARADLVGTPRFVVLSATVRAGSTSFPLDVLVDAATLTLLIRTFCDPAELAPRPSTDSTAKPQPPSLLALMVSLNESLLRRRLPSLHKEFVETTAEGEFFPFAAFIDLVPDRDAAVVMQNYVLRALGKRSLHGLFRYADAVTAPDGTVSRRFVTPCFVDNARLFRFLPQVARDAWESGARDGAIPVAEYRALNQEILAGIHRASCTRQLLLSPRAHYILERHVVPRLREAGRSSVALLSASGVPFATLQKLSRPAVQQLLAGRPAREICLCLLAAESRLSFVLSASSRTRGKRLKEDLAALRRALESGSVDSAQVVAAMQAMETAARKALEEAAKPDRRALRAERASRARAAAETRRGGEGGAKVRYKGWARPQARAAVADDESEEDEASGGAQARRPAGVETAPPREPARQPAHRQAGLPAGRQAPRPRPTPPPAGPARRPRP